MSARYSSLGGILVVTRRSVGGPTACDIFDWRFSMVSVTRWRQFAFVLFSLTAMKAAAQNAPTTMTWPTKGWPSGTPASVGLDEKVLKDFDADIAGGKYTM